MANATQNSLIVIDVSHDSDLVRRHPPKTALVILNVWPLHAGAGEGHVQQRRDRNCVGMLRVLCVAACDYHFRNSLYGPAEPSCFRLADPSERERSRSLALIRVGVLADTELLHLASIYPNAQNFHMSVQAKDDSLIFLHKGSCHTTQSVSSASHEQI